MVPPVRTLLGGQRLGLDGYRERRQTEEQRSEGERQQFRQRIQNFVDGTERVAFAEDLRRLLHMTTADEHDQQLITRMMVRYHRDGPTLRFAQFKFGPIVMRMYWHFNLPDLALEAFRRPELDGFFDQVVSFSLLMDLLYRHGRYAEVLETFTVVQDRRVSGAQFPRECVVLALAACYQLNTPEAFERACQLLRQLQEAGLRPVPRAVALAAALMHRQGQPQRALQLMREAHFEKSSLIRDLQAVCLAELGRTAEAVQSLQQPLLADPSPTMRMQVAVRSEVVAVVDEAVGKKNDAELTAQWRQVKNGLESYSLISSKTLLESLTEPLRTLQRSRHASDLEVSFNRGHRARRSVSRVGLTDMVD